MNKKNIAVNLSNQLFISVVQFFSYIFAARTLTIDENGEFVLGLLIANTISNILLLGINSSNIHFYNNGSLSYSATKKISINYWIGCALFILPFIFVFFTFFDQEYLFNLNVKVIFLSLIIGIVTLANQLMYSLMQSRNEFKSYNISFLISVAFQVLSIMLVFYIVGASTYDYIKAILFSQLASLLVTYSLLNKASLGVGSSDIDTIKEYFFYGVKSHFGNVVSFFMSRVDVYMIGIMKGASSAGIYMVAVLFSERLSLLSQAISTAIFPNTSSLSKVERYSLIQKAFCANLVLTLIVAGILSIIIKPLIVILYGNSYLAALDVFFILMVSVVFKSSSRILSLVFSSSGNPEWNSMLSLFLLMINISLNYILIPKYGVVGAAIATSLSYTINIMLRLIILKSSRFSFELLPLIPSRNTFIILRTLLSKFKKR